MNEHDSERIAGLLAADGMEPTDDLDAADVVVLNTCCIRENADNKLYGHLGRLKELKERRPEMQIAVGGCLAQKDRDLVRARAPHVDVVFGTHNLANAPALLARARAEGPIVEILEEHEEYPSALPAAARGRSLGVGHDPDRLRQLVRLLHRAVGARDRGEPADGRHRPRGRGARRRRRGRGHAARPERELLRSGPRRGPVPPAVRRPAARDRRGRRHRPDPVHVAAPEGPPCRHDRGDGRVRERVRAPASAVAVGQRPHAGPHAPRLHRASDISSASRRRGPGSTTSR